MAATAGPPPPPALLESGDPVLLDAWRITRGEQDLLQHRRDLALRTPECGWTSLSALVHLVARKEGQPLSKHLRLACFAGPGQLSHSRWERLIKRYPELLFLRKGKIWLAKPQRHWLACTTQFPGAHNAGRCTCAILSLPLPGEVAAEEETPAQIADREAVAEAARENEAFNEATDALNAAFTHWRWSAPEQGPNMDFDVRTENSYGD